MQIMKITGTRKPEIRGNFFLNLVLKKGLEGQLDRSCGK